MASSKGVVRMLAREAARSSDRHSADRKAGIFNRDNVKSGNIFKLSGRISWPADVVDLIQNQDFGRRKI